MSEYKKIIRLDKYLADMGIGTRSEVKRAIQRGQVTIDGEVTRQPEKKIQLERMAVTFQGEPVGYAAFEYYMLHKPAGVVSATSDPNDKTVLDLIDCKMRKDLFPVGRLDRDTEGLLLITNDGALSHQLLSPKKHVDKLYYAKVRGKVTREDIHKFAEGIEIGEKKPTSPGMLKILSNGEFSEVEVIIHEGKFHQVKRMFEAVGKEVVYLKRIAMGSLVLDEHLLPGEYRTLTEKELEELKQC